MNGTIHQEHADTRAASWGTSRTVSAGGSFIETICSGIAVILAILGLAGVLRMGFAAVSVIALGASLVFEGGTVAARFGRLLSARSGMGGSVGDVGNGMTAEFAAGVAGIILGILALIGQAPAILPAVAAVVYGFAMLLGTAATARLSILEINAQPSQTTFNEVAREAVGAAMGAKILTGLAAVVLGILALVGVYPLMLTLVALLCVGLAIALEVTAITQRVQHMMT